MCVLDCTRIPIQISDITGGPSDEAGDHGGRVHVLIEQSWGTVLRRSGQTWTESKLVGYDVAAPVSRECS